MRLGHLVCIAAAALLSACGLGAEYPQFSATQHRLEGNRTLPGTTTSGPAVFYRDGARLRYEGLMETHGNATVIYDPVRKAAFMLESSATRRRLFAGAAQRPVALQLDPADAPQPLEVAWAALGPENVRRVGRCRVAGERGWLWRPAEPIAPGVMRTACIAADGIVLKLTENDVVLFEATSLERGPQPRSLFEIPETYRIIDDAELAEAEDEPGGG